MTAKPRKGACTLVEDLLRIADDLTEHGGAGRPRQAYLRRSLSTTYYALFHALAKMCADELIGVTQSGSEAWVRVYRALEHGFAKNALSQIGRASCRERV